MPYPDQMFERSKVIAFDYYDGATEGLAFSIKQFRSCYFKLIAWDENQDNRIYVLGEVDESECSKLLALLLRTQESPTTPVWLPNWKFFNEPDEQLANRIISSFRTSLLSSKLLALGEDICVDSLVLRHCSDRCTDKLIEVLGSNGPDDLSNWMSVFKQREG